MSEETKEIQQNQEEAQPLEQSVPNDVERRILSPKCGQMLFLTMLKENLDL